MAQIGTLEVETGSGTVQVPVFEPADVDNDMVRVQTDSGVGVLSLVDPSNAAYPYLRVKTANNGVLAVHDSTTSLPSGSGVIDDFNDGDLSEYQGDTNAFSTTTSTVFEGTHALLSPASSGSLDTIYSQSGLNTYPQAGNSVDVHIYITAGDTRYRAFGFGKQAASGFAEGYEAVVDAFGDKIMLEKRGGSRLGEHIISSIPTGEWLRQNVDWGSSGTITHTLYDSGGTQLAQTSGSDSEFSSGGIEFIADQSTAPADTYWDLAEVL